MAGQIDFGMLTTPNFLGDAVRYQKAGQERRDEEALRLARANGDMATLRRLAPDEASVLERTQRDATDRAAKVSGAQAFAKGDYQAAKSAYADIGDVAAVGTVDEAHDAQTKKIATEAAYLQGILKDQGPDAAIAAYDQRAATYGSNPEQIAQIRTALVADPANTLSRLAGATTYKYQRDPNTGAIIGINEATGEAKEIYKGTPRAASGYAYDEDGNMTYVRGGPRDPEVIAREAGIRRDAVVSRPAKKSAGRAISSIPAPPQGWSKAGG
ncbi:hypothetical protein [Caulobacter sp. FWC2]|uniref:hypothetical protein n=1 Tax=Caulobacter sp. FWC2 TaxID=69664 RepID=UPI000C1479C5|nr:hypothetical protein [Caulobacter sp. FWC2]PIB91293.1 hypothetical protein CSW62_06710 [Caulobacter sp. FWC2]